MSASKLETCKCLGCTIMRIRSKSMNRYQINHCHTYNLLLSSKTDKAGKRLSNIVFLQKGYRKFSSLVAYGFVYFLF
jgi:hypothetical protein